MFRRAILYVSTGISEMIAVILVLRWMTHNADNSVLMPASVALAVFLLLLRVHPAKERAFTIYAGLCLAVVMLFFLVADHVDVKKSTRTLMEKWHSTLKTTDRGRPYTSAAPIPKLQKKRQDETLSTSLGGCPAKV